MNETVRPAPNSMSPGRIVSEDHFPITFGMDWPLDFLEDAETIGLNEIAEVNSTSDLFSAESSDSDLFQSQKNKRNNPSSCRDRPRNKHHRVRRKLSGTPKRPLSGYNVFFRSERKKLVNSAIHHVGFEQLGKVIGQRWKALSKTDRQKFEDMADMDFRRYKKETDAFDQRRRDKMRSDSMGKPHSPSRNKGHSVNQTDSLSSKITASSHHCGSDKALTEPFNVGQAPYPLYNDSHLSPPNYYATTTSYTNTNVHTLTSGMEVSLPSGIFRVSFECYCMTRAEAEEYMSHLSSERPGAYHNYPPYYPY